jgi:hypothetical protein
MTTQSKLGPFITLMLNLTAKGIQVASVANRHPASVVNSLLLAQLVTEVLRRKPGGYPSARVFRIGSSQDCRVGL